MTKIQYDRMVYKFLQNGYPKYFEPFVLGTVCTHKSQVDGVGLEVFLISMQAY